MPNCKPPNVVSSRRLVRVTLLITAMRNPQQEQPEGEWSHWAHGVRSVRLSQWRKFGRAECSHHGGCKAERGTGKSQGQESFKDPHSVTCFLWQGNRLVFPPPPKVVTSVGGQAFKAQACGSHFIFKLQHLTSGPRRPMAVSPQIHLVQLQESSRLNNASVVQSPSLKSLQNCV